MQHLPHPYMVLSIAGSDSGAGAGIQADIKSCAACGVYCTTAITAVTAQNTVGVRHIEGLSATSVEQQMRAVLDDMPITCIKTGMLYSPEIVKIVARLIRHYKIKQFVLDPVMVSTSGNDLIQPETYHSIIDELLPLCCLATPNIPEAEKIAGIQIKQPNAPELIFERFAAIGCRNVLLKGGHQPNNNSIITDLLFESELQRTTPFQFPRLDIHNTHGTGCSLSAAIAAFLAQGKELSRAVAMAETFLHNALEKGSSLHYGAGHGPILHLPYHTR